MNEDRVEQLAGAIEGVRHSPISYHDLARYKDYRDEGQSIHHGIPNHFSLQFYFVSSNECGSIGCIGGFCMGLFPVAKFAPDLLGMDRVDGHIVHLSRVLDIPSKHARLLCEPDFSDINAPIYGYGNITPAQAAHAVRKLPLLHPEDNDPFHIMETLWDHVCDEEVA